MQNDEPLKTILLYGELGEKFGKEFHLAVNSPSEAIRLLSANFKEFTSFFVGEKLEKKYHVFVGEQTIDEKEVNYPFSKKEVLKIVPIIAGAQTGGLKILAGVALIAIGTFVPGAQPLVNVGAALIVGGVTQLLFAPPNTENREGENTPSYMFDGPINTIRQGNPVPVGYGRLRIGSQVIGMSLSSTKVAV